MASVRSVTKVGENIMSKKKNKKGESHEIYQPKTPKKMKRGRYEKELAKLEVELVKLQGWIKAKGLKVALIFEGRDSAGKGGVIKRITYRLSPRVARVVATPTPTDKEKSQWYFQRYVPHLPSAGEMVLFDRSWYNRAGVEKVMEFCTEDEYQDFLRACPNFERMLVRSGIILIKYWFSVSAEEQESRLRARLKDPTKRWKISPIDLAARLKWKDYSIAKDLMFAYTDTKLCPWMVVSGDSKRTARLNCIHNLLETIPFEKIPPEDLDFPERSPEQDYTRSPMREQTFVPEIYS